MSETIIDDGADEFVPEDVSLDSEEEDIQKEYHSSADSCRMLLKDIKELSYLIDAPMVLDELHDTLSKIRLFLVYIIHQVMYMLYIYLKFQGKF